MKQLKFESNNKQWLVVDSLGRKNYYDVMSDNLFKGVKLEFVNFVKEITEKQASEVVDDPIVGGFYPKYGEFEDGANKWYCLLTSIKSLHSLLKSKGIHLYENPISNDGGLCMSLSEWRDAETKTFYNPYLFKKI